jgi:hypothetical protein
MLPPPADALLLEPADDGLPLIAAVATELKVRKGTRAGLLPDPTNRDVQALRYLGGIEQAVGHVTSRTART